MGGGRRRGMMAVVCFNAVGERQERALNAGSPWRWPHAASLDKYDITDQGESRRATTSFWKRFRFYLGLLELNVILPHAILFTQEYGPGP